MARGRMLNRSVSFSVKFNNLPDDTARLLASWLIPHLDLRGVFYGDASIVKSQVFPMREDLTIQRVQHSLDAIENAGLFKTFQAKDRKWMFWPGFTHNQKDLRRESSEYPPPPSDTIPAIKNEMPNEPTPPRDDLPDSCRTPSGNLPATIPPNLIEVNVIEVKCAVDTANPASSLSDATKPTVEGHSSTLAGSRDYAELSMNWMQMRGGDDTVKAIRSRRKADEATRDAVLTFYAALCEHMPHKTPNVSAWFAKCETFKAAYRGNAVLVNQAASLAASKGIEPNTPDGLVWAIDEIRGKSAKVAAAPQRRIVKEVINGVEVERIVYEKVSV